MNTPIILTSAAVDRLKNMLSRREKPAAGIRITIQTKGCSGLQYRLDYADEKKPLDEEVLWDNLKIFIDPRAMMFILGTEMDFVTTNMQSGFVFNNPNEKGKCGCGKSFHV